MSQENVELVTRTYERLNEVYRTGDYEQGTDSLGDLCHQDIVLQTSGMFPESGEYHGLDGLRRFTQNQAEAFEATSVEPIEFIEADDRVVVPVRFGGTARHSGIQTTFSVVHVWTIREGKFARLDMCRDRAEALKAVEQEE